MFEVVRYRAEHLAAIEPVFAETQYKLFATPALAKALEGPFAYTAMANGRPVAAAGLANKWVDYWVAWAYMSADAGKHMVPITRAVRRILPELPKGRIEAATPISYGAGCRWLEMLGFKCETPEGMAHYTPDGKTFSLYSRVN